MLVIEGTEYRKCGYCCTGALAMRCVGMMNAWIGCASIPTALGRR